MRAPPSTTFGTMTAIDAPDPYDADVAQLEVLLRDSKPEDVPLAEWVRETHGELRRLARSERRHAQAGDTYSTTALINETWLRFLEAGSRFRDRQHFFATAARAMRQILIDHVRRRRAAKRGGGADHDSIDDALDLPSVPALGADVLDIHAALSVLERTLPRPAQVAQLRFFAGLGDQEIASVLDIDESTVRRDWTKARAWLYLRLGGRVD